MEPAGESKGWELFATAGLRHDTERARIWQTNGQIQGGIWRACSAGSFAIRPMAGYRAGRLTCHDTGAKVRPELQE